MRNTIRATRIQWNSRRYVTLASVATAIMAIGLLLTRWSLPVAKAAQGTSLSISNSGGLTLKFSGVTDVCPSEFLIMSANTLTGVTDTRLVTLTNTGNVTITLLGGNGAFQDIRPGMSVAFVTASVFLGSGLSVCVAPGGQTGAGTVTVQ